jgi:hypothetical protein
MPFVKVTINPERSSNENRFIAVRDWICLGLPDLAERGN